VSQPRAHPHEKPHHPHWPLACLLFVCVGLLGLTSVHVSGTWLHIKLGATILAERSVPRVDQFSYMVAGRPWTTDSWLADVFMYFIHGAFGPSVLVLLKSVAAAAAFSLLLPLNPASPLVAASVLGLGAIASWTGLTETPAVLDLLLLAGMIRLLRPRKGFHWSMVAQVAGLEMLWANVHGTTAILGLWLIGLKVFKASLRTVKRERIGYWVLLAAAAVAMSINPHGFSLVPHMFDGGTSWAAWQPLSPWLNWYALFAVAGLASCWLTLQQEFFLTMTAATLLALSLLYQGLRPLYILAVCPVITLALGHALKPKADTPARVARWAVVMGALLAAHIVFVTLPLGRSRGYTAVSLSGALHYLKVNGIKGRMFNEAEAGFALIAGDRAVFVDPRARLHGSDAMRDAARWPESFKQLHGVYRFDYAVILNRRGRYPAKVLDEDPDWRLGYADDEALVYLNRLGANGWTASRQPKTVLVPNHLWPSALDAALARPQTASQALAELDRWLVQSPDSLEVLIWKGYALDRLKLVDKADRLLELARARPRLRWDPELQAALGYVYERRGDRAAARKLYLKAALLARRRGDNPLEGAALGRLAGLHRQDGEEPRARELERRVSETAAAPAPAEEP
jgi:tetratricopeptide (TPR) repeat protein